jgi:AbrB family looped-hinge helix DNA binding protein
MTTTVSTRGRVVLPAKFRQREGIEAGQKFEVERLHAGEYLLRRLAPTPNEGMVDWLLACPEKGYFVAIESKPTKVLP